MKHEPYPFHFGYIRHAREFFCLEPYAGQINPSRINGAFLLLVTNRFIRSIMRKVGSSPGPEPGIIILSVGVVNLVGIIPGVASVVMLLRNDRTLCSDIAREAVQIVTPLNAAFLGKVGPTYESHHFPVCPAIVNLPVGMLYFLRVFLPLHIK